MPILGMKKIIRILPFQCLLGQKIHRRILLFSDPNSEIVLEEKRHIRQCSVAESITFGEYRGMTAMFIG